MASHNGTGFVDLFSSQFSNKTATVSSFFSRFFLSLCKKKSGEEDGESGGGGGGGKKEPEIKERKVDLNSGLGSGDVERSGPLGRM